MVRRTGPSGPLDGYDGDYLQCRNLGHVWNVWGYYRRGSEVYRHLDCRRCRTERIDHWGTNGARLGNRYLYVEGYRIDRDDDDPRLTTTDVRIEMMRRAKVYSSEQAMLDSMTTND